MPKKTSIILTGRTIDWDDIEHEQIQIEPHQARAMRKQGFEVGEVGGMTLAYRELRPEDGTVTLQPKSSFLGRVASAGGHTNFGYAGYFKALVFLGGKRNRLVDFWRLFDAQGHHFPAQQDKNAVARSIEEKIAAWKGKPVVKVKGGYAFFPDLAEAKPHDSGL